MAASTYDEALRRLLAHEGGYSNHPSDPGGPTNFGITLADYRKYIDRGGSATDVRRMSVGQAKAIYKSKYWNAMRCDELPAGVDYAVFDYGVNSGIGRAPKVLKRVFGMNASNSTVTPEVIAAASKRDAKAVVAAICDERLRFLKALRTWPTFGAGWGRRVAEVRTAATAMANRGAPRPVAVRELTGHDPTPGKAQVPEPKITKEALRTGAPTVAAAAGATFWDWVVSHPKASVVIAIAVGVAVGYGLYRLKQWHQAKQNTPMPDTPVVPESVGKGD